MQPLTCAPVPAQQEDIQRLDGKIYSMEAMIAERLASQYQDALRPLAAQLESLASVHSAHVETTNSLHSNNAKLSEQLRIAHIKHAEHVAGEFAAYRKHSEGVAAECAALQSQAQADRHALVVATTHIQELALELKTDKESRQKSTMELRKEIVEHLKKVAERVGIDIVVM